MILVRGHFKSLVHLKIVALQKDKTMKISKVAQKQVNIHDIITKRKFYLQILSCSFIYCLYQNGAALQEAVNIITGVIQDMNLSWRQLY